MSRKVFVTSIKNSNLYNEKYYDFYTAEPISIK